MDLPGFYLKHKNLLKEYPTCFFCRKSRRWRELESEYFKELEKLTGKKPGIFDRTIIPQKYLMLLTPNYFQRSFHDLFFEKKVKIVIVPTDQTEGESAIKLTDGSLVYDRKSREMTVDEVRAFATGHLEDYRLSKFNKIDPEYKMIFEKFVQSLAKDDVEVIFFLPPYHPATFELMKESDQYDIIYEVLNYFANYAQFGGIRLEGYYIPEMCGMTEADFFDNKHPKREAVTRLFTTRLKGTE